MKFAAVSVLSVLAAVNGDCSCEKSHPVCSSRDHKCYRSDLKHPDTAMCPSGCTSRFVLQRKYDASVQDAIDKAEQSLGALQDYAFDIKDRAYNQEQVTNLAHWLVAPQSDPGFQSLSPHEKMEKIEESLHATVKKDKEKARELEKAARVAARSVKHVSRVVGRNQRHSGQPESVYQETSQSGEYMSERFEDQAEDAKDAVENFAEKFESSVKHAVKADLSPKPQQPASGQPAPVLLSAPVVLSEKPSAPVVLSEKPESSGELEGMDMLLVCIAGVAGAFAVVSAFSSYRRAATTLNESRLLQ